MKQLFVEFPCDCGFMKIEAISNCFNCKFIPCLRQASLDAWYAAWRQMESSGTFSAFEIGGLNDGIAEDQLTELRSQTALLRNLKFKGIPWKED